MMGLRKEWSPRTPRILALRKVCATCSGVSPILARSSVISSKGQLGTQEEGGRGGSSPRTETGQSKLHSNDENAYRNCATPCSGGVREGTLGNLGSNFKLTRGGLRPFIEKCPSHPP